MKTLWQSRYCRKYNNSANGLSLIVTLHAFIFCSTIASAQEKPTFIFTVGTTTTTNIFNNVLDVADKFTDVNLQLVVPARLNTKTKGFVDYFYKQDWKKDNDELNVTIQQLGARLFHQTSKKLSSQLAFIYQDYDIYRASGFSIGIQNRFPKTKMLKMDYTYLKRVFSNPVQNGGNHTLKLSYVLPVDVISIATPFYQYELNTAQQAQNLEYKSHTLGIRYDWKDWRKPKKKISYYISYDYRIRNYDTPFLFKGMLSAKQEKRYQFNAGITFTVNQNTKFLTKYMYFDNQASSDNALYVKGKTYRVHIFSVAFQFTQTGLKSGKPHKKNIENKQNPNNETKGVQP